MNQSSSPNARQRRKIAAFLGLIALTAPTAAIARDFNYTYESQTITYTVINEEAKTCETKCGTMITTSKAMPGNRVMGNLIIPAIVKDGTTEYRVIRIGDCSFADNQLLHSVEIPNSVNLICANAFTSCEGLTYVKLPNSIKTIQSSFRNCRELSGITLPDSIEDIRPSTFENCESLESIRIPRSVKYLEHVFGGCTNLTEIIVDELNDNYCTVNGVLFNKDKTKIVTFPAGEKDRQYEIPDGTITIGVGAFDRCWHLESIKCPPSVEKIGGNAFERCYGLTFVEIPNSNAEIRDYAFNECTQLKSINIPDSANYIRQFTYYRCKSLKSIYIPNHIKEIEREAFNFCDSISKIYVSAVEPPYCQSRVFSQDVYSQATLYVPEASVEAYKEAETWKDFHYIIGDESLRVSEIPSDRAESQRVVYNLRGVRVGTSTENLPKGIYIVRDGAKVSKVAI